MFTILYATVVLNAPIGVVPYNAFGYIYIILVILFRVLGLGLAVAYDAYKIQEILLEK